MEEKCGEPLDIADEREREREREREGSMENPNATQSSRHHSLPLFTPFLSPIIL